MTEPGQARPFEQLARRIVEQGDLLRAWPLSGGISAAMTALEIAAPEGGRRKVVVRHYGQSERPTGAATDIDYADLPYWDLCATLRFLRFAQGNIAGMAEFFSPYGRADITERTIRRDMRYFVEQALIALGA